MYVFLDELNEKFWGSSEKVLSAYLQATDYRLSLNCQGSGSDHRWENLTLLYLRLCGEHYETLRYENEFTKAEGLNMNDAP